VGKKPAYPASIFLSAQRMREKISKQLKATANIQDPVENHLRDRQQIHERLVDTGISRRIYL